MTTPVLDALQTAYEAATDALGALQGIETPAHPVAHTALYKAMDGLFQAASDIHLAQLALATPRSAPAAGSANA